MANKKKQGRTRNSNGRGLNWGGPKKKTSRWEPLVIVAFMLAGVGYFIWSWSTDQKLEETLLALAAEGEPLLEERLERHRDNGRRHLGLGEIFQYGDRYPTSGPHSSIWTRTGVHDSPQPSINLVHALEHGNIVIYIDQPAADVRKTIEEWAGLYTGQWDGIVVTADPGLGEGMVLSAWRHRIQLERFEPEIVAAFIDRFRGRGPEQAVR